MAIIFPANCRNVTTGALRQLSRDGHTTASKGLVAVKQIRGRIAHSSSDYFLRTEPAGQFMEALENTKQQINENTDAILAAGHKLVEAARDANKQMAEVSGKFRHGTESLGTAIDKLMKVAGRGDYEKTVRLTESLVDSLERLAALEEKGVLDKVMRAMGGQS